MSLLVDTSVWTQALRRGTRSETPEVRELRRALTAGDLVTTTGLILQELLQGFRTPAGTEAIAERFGSLPLLVPDRSDYVEAAAVRNRCRREGVQVGTTDALLARLCIRHDLTLLTTDRDFDRVAVRFPLRIWGRKAPPVRGRAH